jgi:hypothetical protein
MNIIDDIKLQYKVGGVAFRIIYWNVGCFLVSLVFYQYSAGAFNFPSGLLCLLILILQLNHGPFLTYSFFS